VAFLPKEKPKLTATQRSPTVSETLTDDELDALETEEPRAGWEIRQLRGLAERQNKKLDELAAEIRKSREALSVECSVAHKLVAETSYMAAQVTARDTCLDTAEAEISKLGGEVPARYLT
jgi:hypothetical protein